MPDRDIIIKGCENWVNNHKGQNFLLTYSSVVELLDVLKELDGLLHKKQKDIDRLCVEISELKHRIHDDVMKEHEGETGHWIVLEYCANEGVYCSECHTKMFDRYPMKKKLSQFCGHCGAKMDDEVEGR